MTATRAFLVVGLCSLISVDAPARNAAEPTPRPLAPTATQGATWDTLGASSDAQGLQKQPLPPPTIPTPTKRALLIVVEENQSETESANWWGLSSAVSATRPTDLLPTSVKSSLAPISTAVNPLLSAANVPGVRVVDDLVAREIRKHLANMLGSWLTHAANAAGLPAASCARTSLVNAANHGMAVGVDPFKAFIDRVGEAAMGSCLKQMADPYYTKVEVLTDAGATFASFKARLKDLSNTGHRVDILLDVHGCESPATHNNRACTQAGLRFPDGRVIKERVAAMSFSGLSINAVYMVACWGSRFAPSWLTAGAKAANGSNEINYFVLLSPFVFLDQYTRGGRTLKDAAQLAFDADRKLHEGGTYPVTLSLQPFFDQYLPRGTAGLLPCAGINFNGQVIGYQLVRDKSGSTDLCVRQQPIPALPETVPPGCPPTYAKEIRAGADRCLAPDPIAAACGGSRSKCSWSWDIAVQYRGVVNSVMGRRYGDNPNLPVDPAWSSARTQSGDLAVKR